MLFVCVENSNRSQMAEAFARLHGGKLVEAYSAGSHPSGKVNPKAIAAMRERGYDLSAHGSKSLEAIPQVEYDFVATMGCGDVCPFVRARVRADWQIPDPKNLGPAEFGKVRDLIEEKVRAALAAIDVPAPEEGNPAATVTTRAFEIADYDAAIALWREAEGIEICEGDSRAEIAGYLARNPGLSRVAEASGVIVGAALCGHDGRRGWIYHLVVAPTFRAQGVGRLLVEDCLRGLREAGLPRAIILVAADNVAGREFWLRQGWEDISGAVALTKDLS